MPPVSSCSVFGTLLADETRVDDMPCGSPVRFVPGLRRFREHGDVGAGRSHCDPRPHVHGWSHLGGSEIERKTSDRDMGKGADGFHLPGLRRGYDGCNGFFGSHEDGSHVAHPDGTISFPSFVRTFGGCPFPLILTERQSENLLAALADAKQYQVLGNRLEIRDGSGKVRLVMVNRSPLVGAAEDLTGTAWRLASTDGKAPRGTPPTLAFWDEAFVEGTVADYGFVPSTISGGQASAFGP